MTPPRHGSFAVGQRERLTVRLGGLIRQYQRGPGIIKEFLQNADDAGAKHLRIVMDWRDRTRDSPDPRLRHILGPALLVANDAEFSDSDFEDILHIGESGKRAVTSKTGRFGLGFNTAYNVTDYPSFLSREWMYCFDPHGDAVAEGRDDGGRGFPLTDLRLLHPAWLSGFEAGGLNAGTESYAGTIFRLPLRSSDRATLSEISPEPFDETTFREILRSFIEEGPSMLLFTRHVLDLKVEEILATSGAVKPLLSIRTKNTEEVTISRGRVYPQAERKLDDLAADWKGNPAPHSVHFHSMLVETDAGERQAAWRVAIGFYPDPAGALVDQAKKLAHFEEKAIPEAGVAVALHGEERGLSATAVEGHLYCGLPLPAASGLPVQINGCFDLDASRSALTSDESSLGNAKARVDWNRLLLKHSVTAAYVEALRSIPRDMAEGDPRGFYSLWPNVQRASSPMLREAAIAIHRALASAPLFRCETNGGVVRRSLPEVFLIPQNAEPSLKEPLVADGLVIADPPLPSAVLYGAATAGITAAFITPALLRKRWLRSERKDCVLEDAPFPALRRRDWLETVTRFVISEPNAPLQGLPLALLENGCLATFGFAGGGKTFSGSQIQRTLFRTRPHWFIDADYLTATGLKVQPSAKFVEMTPGDVMRNLHSVLPKIEVGSSREWEPNGDQIPDGQWLRLLVDYLVENAATTALDDLQQFPLVPDQHGKLHTPHCVTTPLNRSPESSELIRALEALGIPLVSGPDELVQAIGRLSQAFKNELVFEADAPDLIDVLDAYEDQWRVSPFLTDPNVYGPILDCLSQPHCLDRIESEWLDKLKRLNLVPTSGGALVTALEPNLFIPSGEQPPKAAGIIKVVTTGSRGRWTSLFEKLGIAALDLPTLILRVLLPAYGDQTSPERFETLRYIRDNFSRALDQEASGGEAPSLKRVLGDAELVVANDGSLRAASQLFAPATRDAITLLGDLAAFPDMEVYSTGRDAWMTFFLSLGLKQEVKAKDLLGRIRSLVSSPPSRESRRAIQRIFVFIQKHWDTLSGQPVGESGSFEQFSAALKECAWLGSVQDEAAFPGFKKPEDRWYRLDELYPRSLGHRVCSQAPLLEGPDPAAHVQIALGMVTKPPLELVISHFDRVRQLWEDRDEAVDVASVRISLNQIYTYFGQQSRPPRGDHALSALLKSRYEHVPCIWDHPQRRFMRPRDCFSERVPFFEPHKVFIGGDVQIQTGLDALGRREKPELEDYVEFLQILHAYKDGGPCDSRECEQVLHALNFVSTAFDDDEHGELVVLTTARHLYPLSDVLNDDAPHWKGRIDTTDINIIDTRVPVRIRLAAPRLTDSIQEFLDEPPVLSANREVESVCQRVSAILTSQEFAHGLKRIIAQRHNWHVSEFVPDVDRFDVLAATSIVTGLYLRNPGDGSRRLGGGEVALFIDNEASKIWVATASPRKVAIELAIAIDQLLGEFRGVELAALEDMLRVSRKEEIEEVLDERRVPRFKEAIQPTFLWDDANRDVEQEDQARGSTPTADNDHAAAASSPNDLADLSVTAKEPPDADEELSRPDSDAPDPAAPPDPVVRTPESGSVTSQEIVVGGGPARSQSSSPRSSRGTVEGPGPRRPSSDDKPPITPGEGSSGFPSTTKDKGYAAGVRDETGAPSPGKGNRGRFVTYVSSASDSDSGLSDPERSEQALEIGRLAVECVLAFERRQGREPLSMPHSNPGYDVISTDPGGAARYIEVKGIDGPWGELGVAVSKRQFEFASVKAADAWLYVVEHVRDDLRAVVFTINDPTGKITHFCFDAGWRAVAEDGGGQSGLERVYETPIPGSSIVLPGGELAEVIKVEKHGLISRLTVRSTSGDTQNVIWRPGMKVESRGSP